MAPSAAPIAAMRAEAEPPPGAGVREPRSSTKPRTLREASGSSSSFGIMYSMMRFSGTKGCTDERPSRSTTRRIFCRSSRMKRFSFAM